MDRSSIVGALMLFAVSNVSAQILQLPSFEVASIKPNVTGSPRFGHTLAPRTFTGTNVSTRALIRYAYGIQDFQLVGGPDWAERERYDVVAKSDHEPDGDEMRQMMQALLAERFHLVVHKDQRELPIYALVVARADRQIGPGLTPIEKECTTDCGASVRETRQAATLVGRGISMDALAARLSDSVNRVVVDRTEMRGSYDVQLSWTPDQSSSTTGASIFTAVQEQLGLRLESARGPVDVLVIDGIEHPTAD